MPETKLTYADLGRIGPGTIAGRYMRLFWHPVYRARDLPAGRAKPITILGEKFTLYRGRSGTPYVAGFRCPHRGTQLSLGWVEEDALRCRYHGWKYDASGQCIERPGEDQQHNGTVRLRTYPTREYAGLVFAYLGEGEAPPFPRYPDLDRTGVIVADPPERLPCNFWNRMDNDIAHIPWVHRATATRMNQLDWLILRYEEPEETDYGFILHRTGEGLAPYSTYFYMPNIRHFGYKTRARGYEHLPIRDTKFTWCVPVDDEHFVSFDVTHTPLEGEDARAYAEQRASEQEHEAETRWDIAEKILAGELTLEEMPEEVSHYNGFAIEDYVTQVGQGSFADRSSERLGKNDNKVLFQRRLWLRELSALAEGRPVKQWSVPTQPFGEIQGSAMPAPVAAKTPDRQPAA